MKVSEKYLAKHRDDHANFGYKDSPGYYSEAGIEVEHAEVYGNIRFIEGMIDYIEMQVKVFNGLGESNSFTRTFLRQLMDDKIVYEAQLKKIEEDSDL